MRRSAIAAAMALASLSAVAATAAPTQAVLPSEQHVTEKREKEMRRAVASGSLAKPRRSRGPQAKPKRKPNRLHVRKRARRKHRRAP